MMIDIVMCFVFYILANLIMSWSPFLTFSPILKLLTWDTWERFVDSSTGSSNSRPPLQHRCCLIHTPVQQRISIGAAVIAHRWVIWKRFKKF